MKTEKTALFMFLQTSTEVKLDWLHQENPPFDYPLITTAALIVC